MRRVDRKRFAPHNVRRDILWCGVVFSLAVLLTALNAFPPMGIVYQVSTEVIVSPSRLVELRRQTHSNSELDVKTPYPKVRLMSIEVLDRRTYPPQEKVVDPELVLVRVDSLWPSTCTSHDHSEWLDSISRTGLSATDNSSAARQLRMARWDLVAAEHYAARHEFLKPGSEASTENKRNVFQLARHTRDLTTVDPANADAGEDAVEVELQREVLAAREAANQTELAWMKQTRQSCTLLEVASPVSVEARPESIPFKMFASILVVGLASGGFAGWFQIRHYMQRMLNPLAVAGQLEQDGVPMLAQVALPSHGFGETAWWTRINAVGSTIATFLARNLTRFSEWILGSWVLLILLRILFDGMWRDILIESPLAAFARVLAGLP